jgi:hypothetical protein
VRERDGLVAYLETPELWPEQIQDIQEFAAKVRQNLETVGDDFEAKRRIVEELDVWVTLIVEDGKKAVYARCI